MRKKSNIEQCFGILWAVVSLISFVALSIITQQLLDSFFSFFVSAYSGIIMSIGLFGFICSVAVVFLSFFDIIFGNDQISLLINISATFVFALCAISYSVMFGSKITFINESENVYQNAIIKCNTDKLFCDQFKQTIGDIETTTANEYQNLVKMFVKERTTTGSAKVIPIFCIWTILHLIVTYYVFQ